MKKLLTLALLLVTAATAANAQSKAFGWASVDGMTNGSRNQNPVVVTTYEELKKQLHRDDSIPRTIYVKGKIQFPRAIKVANVKNKTIYGLPGSALVNNKYTINSDSTGILTLDGCHNIIIRNVTFMGPGAFDRDNKDNLDIRRTDHVWVDHCDFQDGMDGNFDIAKGSDLITVSWCRFRYLIKPWPVLKEDKNEDHTMDHRFSNLIGSSDKDSLNDEGKLRITFADCWWDEGCRNRMPMARYGLIHVYNCLYSSSVASTCLNVRFRSNVYAENCAFTTKNAQKKAWKGIAPDKNNNTYNLTLKGCLGVPDIQTRNGDRDYWNPADYYSYQLMPAIMVAMKVGDENAGAGATLEIPEPNM